MTLTKEQFLHDVSGHTIEIKHDSGLFRYFTLRNGGALNRHFNIGTTPDFIQITGDMGCLTFKPGHSEDALIFFRQKELEINDKYWSEKLCGPAAEIKQFNPTLFKNSLFEAMRDEECLNANIWDDVQAEVLVAENENEARDYMRTFRSGTFPPFQDSDEFDFTEYKPNYLWCLYAIVWGIEKYDEAKKVRANDE